MKKFNEIQDAEEANKFLGIAMNAYQKARRDDDEPIMRLTELLMVTCGGSLQQCSYPSEFMLLLINTGLWQNGRDRAQSDLEAAIKELSQGS